MCTVQGDDCHRDPGSRILARARARTSHLLEHTASSSSQRPGCLISFYIQEGAPHSFMSLDVCSVSCPLLWDRVLLGSLGCSGILCRRGWPWTEGDPAASASQLLGLLGCATCLSFRGRWNHWVRVVFILVKVCVCVRARACARAGTTVSMWRPKDNFLLHSLLLSLLGFWGSNSCCQAFEASGFFFFCWDILLDLCFNFYRFFYKD